MDIDSYDHVEIERNGAASNSDRYITPVEYQSLSCWSVRLIVLVIVPASA